MTDQPQTTLYLARPLINKVLAHAQKNPDVEICGLIGTEVSGASLSDSGLSDKKEYYPIDNVSKNPSCQFLMDAPQQIKTMKQMREKQQQLFAIVHSHPKSGATPSSLDIKQSGYKDVFYLIISLNTVGVLEIRAYIQQQNSMQEIDLILEETG